MKSNGQDPTTATATIDRGHGEDSSAQVTETFRASFGGAQRARLAAWTQDLQLLKIRSRKLELSARAEADEQLRRIRALRDRALARVEDLHGARDRSWQRIQGDLVSLGATLSRALEEAKRWFGDQPTRIS